MLKKNAILLLLSCSLTACAQPVTTAYYFKHPKKLEKILRYCQELNPVARSREETCDVAIQAAEQLSKLIEEWQAQPEDFGHRILQTQYELVEAKNKVAALSAQLSNDKNNADRADVELKLNAAEADYKAKQHEVAAMMAVAGLASPE